MWKSNFWPVIIGFLLGGFVVEYFTTKDYMVVIEHAYFQASALLLYILYEHMSKKINTKQDTNQGE